MSTNNMFSLLLEDICCGTHQKCLGYSSEVPCQSASVEYSNICFCGYKKKKQKKKKKKKKKKNVLCGYPRLSGAMTTTPEYGEYSMQKCFFLSAILLRETTFADRKLPPKCLKHFKIYLYFFILA